MSKEETSAPLGLTFKRSTIGGVAALALAASPAYALTLGEAEVMSGLNQKFQAEIDLGAITQDELSGLAVRVAPDADYIRANLETGGVERNFSFSIVGSGDDAAIRVTSKKLISEPLVVFLLEARWQRGRLLREYAVFLDPVDPDQEQQFEPRVEEPKAEAPVVEPVAEVEPSAEQTAAERERSRLRASTDKPTHPDALPELPYHYGPVKKGVTGIQVATELAQGTVLTPEQMLMALFEVNPVAFHGNVNGLDAGFMLRIPDAEDIATINSSVAADEISRHNAAWKRHVAAGGNNKVVVQPLSVEESQQEQRAAAIAAEADEDTANEDEFSEVDDANSSEELASSVAEANDSTAEDSDEAGDADEDVADSGDDRLELVAPEDSSEKSADAVVAASSNPEVAAAQAETAALRVENAQLREQLSETESLLLDIRSLLVARSDELSELKARIAKLEGGEQSSASDSQALEVIRASDSEASNNGQQAEVSSDDSIASNQVEAASSADEQQDSQSEDGSNSDLESQDEKAAAPAKPMPKPEAPQSPTEANNASSGDDLTSTISNTFDSVVQTVISIGWLILLPLILLLLIIVLFLVRRRKKEEEPEEISAGSVDEISADEDDDSAANNEDAPYSPVPGVEVTTGSMEDYSDDFTDELADESIDDEFADETSEIDEADDFSDELGDDFDDSDLLDEGSADDFLALDASDDEFDILLPPVDSSSDEEDPAEDDSAEEVIEDPSDELSSPPVIEDTAATDDEHDDLLSFDEGDYEAPEEPAETVEMDATEDDLDFDLGDFEISEPEPTTDVASDMPSVDMDEDFGLDESFTTSEDSVVVDEPSADSLDDIVIGDSANDALMPDEDDVSALDDLVLDGASDSVDLDVDSEVLETEAEGFDIDAALDDTSPNVEPLVDEAEPEAAEAPEAAAAPVSDADMDIAAFAGGDQANTKLDLAKAYIEMGDGDEARSLLEEVIAEADGAVKAEAEAALAELG